MRPGHCSEAGAPGPAATVRTPGGCSAGRRLVAASSFPASARLGSDIACSSSRRRRRIVVESSPHRRRIVVAAPRRRLEALSSPILLVQVKRSSEACEACEAGGLQRL